MTAQIHALHIVQINQNKMSANSIEYIRLLANLAFVVPLTFYVAKLRHSPLQNHIIAALIALSACVDLLTYFGKLHAPPLYNIFTVIEFALITSFYYKLVYSKRGSLVMLISIGVFIATFLFSALRNDTTENYTTLWTVESILILIHGLVYIFNIQEMPIDRYFDAHLLSNMIFNMSFFFYATVTILIFGLTDVIFRQHDIQTIKAFWAFHNMIAILKNVGFAIAFYYTGKREIYMTLEQLEKIARKLEEEGQQPD
ncbi:MAG TPA: hypothetical protein VGD65_21525 [Chryseosolibacter sp.]